ncbi:hypothetical protein GBF38_012979, partial [Nibea albiflora]
QSLGVIHSAAAAAAVRPSVRPSHGAVLLSVAPGGAAVAEHVLGCSTGQKGRFPPTHRLRTWIAERTAPIQECCHQAVIHPCIMEAQPGASWELINGVTDTIYEG